MFLFLFLRKNYPTNDHKIMNMKEMMKFDGMHLLAPEEDDFDALKLTIYMCAILI